MMSCAEADCYAIRRVNPFLGVLQIIKTPDGRAISSNGLTWEIQVLAPVPAAWGSLNQANAHTASLRYGLWSSETGLVPWPLSVKRDDIELDRQCYRLIECIQGNLHNLPFTLQDTRELWLLDAEQQQPLALLASIRPAESAPRPEPRYWSSSLGQHGAASQWRFPQSTELEAQVKHRAGFNLDKRWYTRESAQDTYCDDMGNRLQGDTFPRLLLRKDWPEASERDRATNYLQWIASALLTLQHLNDAERAELESQLGTQAASIEHHWRVYPKVLDQQKLNACRVQAQLLELNKSPVSLL
jgi:hypothetical protein